MSRLFSPFLFTMFSLCLATAFLQAGEQINESAREIPIAADVDVVVVGGSTGAVSAAVAAAEAGASVFLAAPHPYLGEDMTATLQLWLEPEEEPRGSLARSIYDDPLQNAVDPNRLQFSYEADTPSAEIHADTSPPGRLTDGQWSDAASQSVQYDRDTTIVADLESVQPVKRVQLMFYRRGESSTAGSGFDVGAIEVHVSDDKQSWTTVEAAQNDAESSESLGILSVPVNRKTRYVKLDVTIASPHERMLLGELLITGPDTTPAKADHESPTPPRPMHVKKVLDDALLDAEVSYLYSCLATGILRDGSGKPCGIVMANRAGRQAVVAKQVIDATTHATVARAAELQLRETGAEKRTMRRVVIGGEPKSGEQWQLRQPCDPYSMLSPDSATADGGIYRVFEYAMSMDIGQSYASLMKADQTARTRTYDPKQQYTSDVLFEVPPWSIVSGAKRETQQIDQLSLEVFQPTDDERLFVLSGYADVPRSVAATLMRPVNMIEYGERVGKLAASRAGEQSPPRNPQVAGSPTDQPAADGDVREFLAGTRPTGRPETISQSSRAIPVLGTYDLVVIGGGTGGAPAGIGAARQGAKTLVVEYLSGLGGVSTEGAIAGYYWGNRVGFTSTILDGATRWEVEPKKEWYRRELLKAGADVWFGSIGCGAFVDGDRVRGAVVTTPYGRGVVLANTVIDATGNSDVAAAAGAECDYTDESEFGMQGTGLPGRRLGGSYNNTDFTIVDETDMLDTWHVFVYSKEKYPRAFDHGRLIDTRERRRIVGDHRISILDQLNQRTYPDTVTSSWSNFDTHGYTIHPYFLLEHPDKKGIA
ncbi:MAG: FAD-dependent oxidoreductase, partial [Planctomycetota bacterium]